MPALKGIVMNAILKAQIEAQETAEDKRSYNFKGYRPYGAGEIYILDGYVDEYFDGNVTEKIINDGKGKFIVKDNPSNAVLNIAGFGDVHFVKRN